MHPPRRSAALLLLVPLLVAGCGGSSKHAAQPSPSVSPTPELVAATQQPGLTGNPLTGLAPVAGPVVAIKVDNAVLARPFQRGLNQAAIVYEELVEGGSTRFMAVFTSPSATHEVGPIRSARESDIELLRGLGRPAIAFSGANSGVLAIFAAAARSGYLYDASRSVAPNLFRWGGSRADANNYFAVPARLGAKVGGSQPRDIGWRFGALPAGGLVTTAARVPFAGAGMTMAVRYVAARGTWQVLEAGYQIPVAPANVVVQYVTTKASRFYDVHGKNTPYTVTLGSGRLVVLRDGKRFVGTWKRNGYGATRLLDASGKDILLKPGATWVMLMPNNQAPSFG